MRVVIQSKIFCFFLLLLASNAIGQFLNTSWANRLGAIGSTIVVNGITTDQEGNVYTTGYFSGPIDFDPGPGTFIFPGNPTDDAFVMKVNASGMFLWAKRIGSRDFESGNSIVADPAGNAYIIGIFNDTIDVDPGPAIHTLTTTSFATATFILKLNPGGEFIWAKEFVGGRLCKGQSIFLDPALNIITSGVFLGTLVDFDPGNSTALMNSAGGGDIHGYSESYFICKLDSSGNFLFVANNDSRTNSGSTTLNKGGDIIYATENYSWYGQTINHFVGIMKYSAFGQIMWKQKIECPEGAGNLAISADGADNIYLTGAFNGSVDFDPGPQTHYLSAPVNGDPSMFLLKLDHLGNFVWVQKIDRICREKFGTLVDNAGNVFITGAYRDTTDFGPGPFFFKLIPSESGSAYILKLNSEGNFQWAQKIGGEFKTYVSSISRDNAGTLYVAGAFAGTCNFNPGTGNEATLTSQGSSNGFICRMTESGLLAVSLHTPEKVPDKYLVGPNPTSGTVNIMFDEDLKSPTFFLWDVCGNKIFERSYPDSSWFLLDLSNQSAGVYVLRVLSANKIPVNIKLVKE